MDDVKLKSLKSTRASIKGQMTKLHNYVVGAIDKKDIDGFQSKLARAKVLLKQFEDVENSIFDLDPDHESGIIDFSEQYYVVESRLNRYIREYNAQNPDETLQAGNNSMNTTMVHPVDVRLPKINIEPFSGQYTEWQSFYDLYLKTIHENSNLSPAQKFQYLKGFLRGDAYNLLRHISITESNYFEAFRKLCARYDRKKHTIKAFIRSFIDQPVIHQPNAIVIRKLLDTSDEVVRGLKALGRDAESRDVWLIYLLEQKLDVESRALWAQISCEEDLPTLEVFFKFLLNRSDALESLRPATTKRLPNSKISKVFVTTETNECPICNDEHTLLDCKKFQQFSVMERRQHIKSDNRCYNCLRVNHSVFRCLSKSRCQICGKKHHTLLHQEEPKEPISTSASAVDKSSTMAAHTNISSSCVLPTALVKVVDQNGFEHECRMLLDSGSMSTFISERLCNKLKIPRRNNRTIVTGISGSGSQVTKGIVTLTLRARNNRQNQIQVDALVMAKLCSKLPTHSFDKELCVQHVFNTLLDGRIKYQNKIVAIETIFGWVLGGEIDVNKLYTASSNIAHIDDEQSRVDDMLKLFWEIEAVPNIRRWTVEEEECERLFVETTQRTTEGRFVVNLPFKKNVGELGNSLSLALSRQKAMEKKFHKDGTFRQLYQQFMQEYRELGHMVEIQGNEVQSYNYLPHHGILKSSKFRVAFDASAKTSTGLALNEILMIGPTVQSTLCAILLRFRLHKIAISADVEKMYRQVLLREQDRKFQAIVWRPSDKEPMKYYKLTTLTYGTAAAPYLATRVLNELADIHRDQFPAASSAFNKNTYVDDLMTGAESVEKAVELKRNLVLIMCTAGMKLRKWVSNSDEFISTTPLEDRAETIKDFIQDETVVKVLGLQWNPKSDVFSYRVNMNEPVFTKRTLLSESSQIFDPLGWLSPVIIKIKILFQTLWLISIDWDDELPLEVKQKWMIIREQLPQLEKVRIPRWLNTPGQDIELHGFCDASERAYAAVVYMRHIINPDRYHCSLLAAKSKVAPVKKLTIAKLELCAAHLLANLTKSVTEILEVPVSRTVCWTDSTIVLDWLSDVPIRWQTFIGNRTSQILEIIKRDNWRHVPTKDNPADCASRGILPSEILTHELWWNSPSWLRDTSEEEKRAKFCVSLLADSQDLLFPMELIERLSSYRKIIGTVAVVQRYRHNLQRGTAKRKGPITVEELEAAVTLCCKRVQIEYMLEDVLTIEQKKPIKGSLKFLTPFIGDDGVMRVGGRIQNSNSAYGTKHPIIIPPSKLSKLIIEDYHNRYYHAGPQLLLTMLRQKFWLINGKREIRQVIGKCLPCFRAKPIPLSQAMGNLPACRVQHVRAFLKVGTDFAGPIQVFHKRGRGQKPFKAYICLFVCTSTRAVHIELTTDLTTNTFLAALRRFVARRGLCTDIYSDCGSNYMGADRHLRKVFSFLKDNANEIYHFLLSESITWHFNPPNAPHFGGLWEAAVKSMKHHLKRVVGETILTVEELQTLLAEIEAILNSRPICALPNEPEFDVLTPSHFIIGHPLVSVPEINLKNEKITRLNRWEMLQQMRQHIWQRWHVEYLTSMQSRCKWTSPKTNVKLDEIVIVIDKNLPPTKWLLGRIIQVFPGSDGLIRVASVKTKNGIFRRPIQALCKVPVESDDSKAGRMLEAANL